MKIAILGNGGREHAIASKISKSPKLEKLYCIPGNAGTVSLAENVELDFYNFDTDIEKQFRNYIEIENYGDKL